MNRTANPGNGYRMAWTPAPAPLEGRSLGQAEFPFTLRPLPALLTDIVVTVTAGFYAWGLGRAKNSWSTLWWVIAAASAMKGLHDISRLEKGQ